MTRAVLDRLPDEASTVLDGRDLAARVGLTIELLTVGEDGWPAVALLSVGEVLALDAKTIRLALWPGTRTTANLSRSGQGVLAFVHAAVAYTVRVSTCRAADLATPAARAVFDGRVVEVRPDVVSYATLRTGITFDLPDQPTVVERWRATIEAVRSHPGCS